MTDRHDAVVSWRHTGIAPKTSLRGGRQRRCARSEPLAHPLTVGLAQNPPALSGERNELTCWGGGGRDADWAHLGGSRRRRSNMPDATLIIVAVVIIAILVAAVWWYSMRQRRAKLQEKFGPEYELSLIHISEPTRL